MCDSHCGSPPAASPRVELAPQRIGPLRLPELPPRSGFRLAAQRAPVDFRHLAIDHRRNAFARPLRRSTLFIGMPPCLLRIESNASNVHSEGRIAPQISSKSRTSPLRGRVQIIRVAKPQPRKLGAIPRVKHHLPFDKCQEGSCTTLPFLGVSNATHAVSPLGNQGAPRNV